RDITERKKAEEALRESEERFRRLSQATFEGIVIHEEGTVLDVNKTFAEMFGYEISEIIGRNVLDFFTPEVRDFIDNNIRTHYEKPYEAAGLRKDGTTFPIENCGKTVRYKGRMARVAVIRDMTERKKAEEALRESEERFKRLSQATFEGIAIHEKGILLDVNKAILNMFGYESSEIVGRNVLDFFMPESHDIVMENVRKESEKPYEASGLKKDGTPFPLEIRGRQITYKGSPAIVAVVRDLTERKKAEAEKRNLEEQLFHSQKMESIGRIAGSIAHDFDNILTGIMGWGRKLKSRYPDIETPDGKAADIINKGALQAIELTQQLLDIAKKRKHKLVSVNIGEIIKETMGVLEKAIGENITVKYNIEDEIHRVRADKNQLKQVFSNIIINAKDAMPDGGELLFRVENTTIDGESSQKQPDLKFGIYVKISISDTGCGMTKDVREKIFEPFFTTKEESRGTGLGLATSYGIMKNHDGHITCISEPDKGTTFILYIPALDK
ncbi:PAS domain S-box protein, partial [bacterium]|nr:PAS domain S-box protein [bacterium]